MTRRIVALTPHLWLNRLRYGRALDILVTHAPPKGIHDGTDPAHVGFAAFNRFIARYKPCFVLHGHSHLWRRDAVVSADPDPASPGMALAEQLGLLTFTDYHQLYDPRYSIHLIIILTPDEEILRDILQTRPERIRILSYHVFQIFWKAIGNEERKLRQRTEEMETVCGPRGSAPRCP